MPSRSDTDPALRALLEAEHGHGAEHRLVWPSCARVHAALAAAEAAPSGFPLGNDPDELLIPDRPDTETVHEPSGVGVSNAIAGERHCTGCGEPWPCLTYRQGRAIVKAVLPSIDRPPDTETAELEARLSAFHDEIEQFSSALPDTETAGEAG